MRGRLACLPPLTRQDKQREARRWGFGRIHANTRRKYANTKLQIRSQRHLKADHFVQKLITALVWSRVFNWKSSLSSSQVKQSRQNPIQSKGFWRQPLLVARGGAGCRGILMQRLIRRDWNLKFGLKIMIWRKNSTYDSVSPCQFYAVCWNSFCHWNFWHICDMGQL